MNSTYNYTYQGNVPPEAAAGAFAFGAGIFLFVMIIVIILYVVVALISHANRQAHQHSQRLVRLDSDFELDPDASDRQAPDVVAHFFPRAVHQYRRHRSCNSSSGLISPNSSENRFGWEFSPDLSRSSSSPISLFRKAEASPLQLLKLFQNKSSFDIFVGAVFIYSSEYIILYT